MSSFLDDPGGGDSLDRKLAQLRADFGEDIAVYDFDDHGMGDLGGALEEDMNDLNDETFGVDTVGKDFDFSGSTAQYLGEQHQAPRPKSPVPTWTTIPTLLSNQQPNKENQSKPASLSRGSAGKINLKEDPLLGPISQATHRQHTALTSQLRPSNSTPISTDPPKGVKVHSLEEIEEELRAKTKTKAPPPAHHVPRALTLEEVEAAMLASTRERNLATATVTGVPASLPAALYESQPSFQTRTQMAQQVQAQNVAAASRNLLMNQPPGSSPAINPSMRASQPPGSLPSMSHPAYPSHPQHSEWLRLQQQQDQMYTSASQTQAHPLHMSSRPPMGPTLNQLFASSSPAPTFSPSINISPAMLMNSAAPQSIPPPSSMGTIPIEDLRSAAEARIQEHERQEVLRRKKAAKIAEMAKYNNLMSQGDKDFITRIQVSQLVNPSHGQAGFDPYADDFYFHVFSAIRASRVVAQQQAQAAAADRRAGLGVVAGPHDQFRNIRPTERRLTRRDHAMIRMAQNVQRVIDHAKERPKMSQVSLEGALGKIALRTRSAPRQMLQVDPTTSDNLATAPGGENHPGALAGSVPATTQVARGQPAMDRRQTLMSLERLYSTVLEVEQLRRAQPALFSPTSPAHALHSASSSWQANYDSQKEKLWRQLRVLDPLGPSHPHPFVSLLSVAKGKRVLPRVVRLLSREQCLQVLTLLVATFGTIDVVRDAPLLDLPTDPRLAGPYPKGRRTKSEIDLETDLFMNCVVAPMMSVINGISLDLVTGLVSLLIERSDLMFIARSRPGIAFLTLFLSRAELLKNGPGGETSQVADSEPTSQAIANWQNVFDQIFNRLSTDFASLFPSTRCIAALPLGTSHLVSPDAFEMSKKYMKSGLDLEDEPVWQLMAALAVSTDSDGQQALVGGLRDKVLENVTAAGKKWVSEEVATLKLRNVNVLLHALGLDSSMINV